jgi:hypothetical protein
VLIEHFLGLVGRSNHWHSNRQSFLGFVKLGATSILVDLIHQVDIQVVDIGVLKHQSRVVNVDSCRFETLNPLDVDSDSQLRRQLVKLIEALTLHRILVALPVIAQLDWVRVNNLELGLDDAFGLLIIGLLVNLFLDLSL